MVYILGEVFSRAEGYQALGNLWGAIIFHTVCMVAGGFFFVKKPAQEAAKPAAEAGKI